MSRLPADTVGGRSSTLNLGVEGGDRPPVILRYAQVLAALRAILEGGLLRYLDQARQILTEPSVPADVPTNGSTPPPAPPSTSTPGGPRPPRRRRGRRAHRASRRYLTAHSGTSVGGL
jgi:hypothetical protein